MGNSGARLAQEPCRKPPDCEQTRKGLKQSCLSQPIHPPKKKKEKQSSYALGAH